MKSEIEMMFDVRVPHAQKTSKLLLDSSLKLATKLKTYSAKIVDCNEFIQVYIYSTNKTKKIKNDFDLNLKKYDFIEEIDKEYIKQKDYKIETQEIEKKNVIRSKLSCQRIAKANIKYWETFITLTFENNITDIKVANKEFKYFIDKVRRIKKDFKYIAIPEFQKRGAVHYHLLTNIPLEDKQLIYAQKDNKKYKHIKYWNCGFNNVQKIKGDTKKIIGYISKYMTKDIDNRLFGKKRYLFSKSLTKPKEFYIDMNKEYDLNIFNKKIQETTLCYQNTYTNIYDNTKIEFLEFLKE